MGIENLPRNQRRIAMAGLFGLGPVFSGFIMGIPYVALRYGLGIGVEFKWFFAFGAAIAVAFFPLLLLWPQKFVPYFSKYLDPQFAQALPGKITYLRAQWNRLP
jgi:hypothetical protein